MINKENRLGVSELLEKTYNELAKRIPHQEIILPKKALAEIGDVSDPPYRWGETYKAYLGYERLNLFRFNDIQWIIGFGLSEGDYTGHCILCDILALKLDEHYLAGDINKFKAYLTEHIPLSSYLSNSLIQGVFGGSLDFSSNRISQILYTTLRRIQYEKFNSFKSFNEFGNTLYKPQFVDFLTSNIEDLLRKVSKNREILS